MADVFTIPLSNSLRFVDMARINEMQNYDNRFVYDLVYARSLPYNWIQNVQQGDPLWFQFRTTYTNGTFSVGIVDENNNKTDLTNNIVLINTDSSGRSYYRLNIDTNALLGCYRFEVSAIEFAKPTVNFISEAFRVDEEVEDSLFIEWIGNERSYDDQMTWEDIRQGIRVNATNQVMNTDQNKSVYDNSDFVPVNLKSKPLRKVTLSVEQAPFWVIEKINIGLSHDEFYVNNVQYNSPDPIPAEELGNLLVNKASIELTDVKFENGEDLELTGAFPVFPDVLRTTGLETRTTGLEDRKTNN